MNAYYSLLSYAHKHLQVLHTSESTVYIYETVIFLSGDIIYKVS